MNARFNDPYRAQRELLSGSKFFADLPPALLNELVEASRLLELPANQTLYEAGDPIREAYLLFNGSVKRSTTIPGGATKVIELVQSEQLLSLGELFGATHYASTCCCITQTLLVAIDIRKLREATENHHELGRRDHFRPGPPSMRDRVRRHQPPLWPDRHPALARLPA